MTRSSTFSGTLRALIFHDGALGDVLLSLPCRQALREAGDALHFVGSPDTGRLLAALAVVDDWTSSDSGMFAALFASGAGEQARAFLSHPAIPVCDAGVCSGNEAYLDIVVAGGGGGGRPPGAGGGE